MKNNIDEDIKNIKIFISSIRSDLEDEAEDNYKLADSMSNVLSELETQINNTHILQSQLDVANAEKIEWKKIAEKLAGECTMFKRIQQIDFDNEYSNGLVYMTKEEVLYWARKEVEKDVK